MRLSFQGCLWFCTLLLCGGCLPHELSAATLHLVTAYDTADPLIDDIAPYLSIDLLFMQSVEPNALQVTRIDKSNMTERGLRNALRGLPVAPDDTVVFYYVGHGRFDEPRRSTCMVLTKDRQSSLSWRDVTEEIDNRGPRLTVVIFDCCSNDDNNRGLGGKAAFAPAIQAPKGTKPLFRRLFFEPQGSVFLCSSSPHEYALVKAARGANNDRRVPVGPIFTSAFAETLEKEGDLDSWDRVRGRTQRRLDFFFDALTGGEGQFPLGSMVVEQNRQTIRIVEQNR